MAKVEFSINSNIYNFILPYTTLCLLRDNNDDHLIYRHDNNNDDHLIYRHDNTDDNKINSLNIMLIDMSSDTLLNIFGRISLQNLYVSYKPKGRYLVFCINDTTVPGYPEYTCKISVREINVDLERTYTVYCDSLLNEYRLIMERQRQKIEKMERKILKLTYAPGGPGYDDAKRHFDQVK